MNYPRTAAASLLTLWIALPLAVSAGEDAALDATKLVDREKIRPTGQWYEMSVPDTRRYCTPARTPSGNESATASVADASANGPLTDSFWEISGPTSECDSNEVPKSPCSMPPVHCR